MNPALEFLIGLFCMAGTCGALAWLWDRHTGAGGAVSDPDAELVEALSEAEATVYMLRGVMESQEAATLIADRYGDIIETTATFERAMGYERGALVGRNVRIFVPEAMRDKHDNWIADFYDDRGALEIRPVTAVKKDGTRKRIALGVNKTQKIKGEALLVATIRDVDDVDDGLGRQPEDQGSGAASEAA